MHPVLDPVSPLLRPSRPGEPAWEVATLLPLQGEWTEANYLALNSSRLVELSDGCLEVLPMPSISHQLIVIYLHEVLKAFVRAHASGLVLLAPLPVRLWEGKFREPDVFYLRPERLRDHPRYPEGADLAMEVVSEGEEDRRRDLVVKRQEYATAGIAEYWIVDPQEQRITVLSLQGQAYREHGTFAPKQKATSVLLPGFEVDVESAFRAGQVVPPPPSA
jgi:Uma2 family endonuclease